MRFKFLYSKIKPYWNTDTLVYLHIVYGCFRASAAELSTWNRECTWPSHCFFMYNKSQGCNFNCSFFEYHTHHYTKAFRFITSAYLSCQNKKRKVGFKCYVLKQNGVPIILLLCGKALHLSWDHTMKEYNIHWCHQAKPSSQHSNL